MFFPILVVVAALFVLVKSADLLVDGASSLAKRLGISSLVIGLTVVAFGTSAPELSVNIASALNNATDIAVGNIVGSNIVNALLILGLVAWMKGVKLQHSTVWKEIPFMVLSMIVLMVMSSDIIFDGAKVNAITATDGMTLLAFFAIFLYYTFGIAKNPSEDDGEIKIHSWIRTIAMVIFGLIGLIFGGKYLVSAAIEIAQAFGLSERFIGLTIVAVGTSLPELLTSIVAAKKNQSDMAVGNVIGSNIVNVVFILGATSLIAPLAISQAVLWDMGFALAASLLIFVFLFIGKRHVIERWQGVAMVAGYVAYILVILMSAKV